MASCEAFFLKGGINVLVSYSLGLSQPIDSLPQLALEVLLVFLYKSFELV